MPVKILGLDIGATAVKAALVTRNFTGSYKIIKSRIINIQDAGGIPEALKILFAEEIFRNAACAISLPANEISFRNLQLPFRDRKKVAQTIVYELEPLIQLPIDDVYVDYLMINKPDGSEIFAAAAGKSLVQERLQLLEAYVKSVILVDVDAVPIAARILEKEEFQEGGVILDIGAKDTVGVFVERGKIRQIRHFNFGGDLITGNIAKVFNITLAEAEAMKKESATTDSMEEIREPLARFFSDIENTVRFLKWRGAMDNNPSRIYLTGGGALFSGIREGLNGLFPNAIELIDISETGAIQMEGVVRDEWQAMIMNQALALATRSAEMGTGFNFRQRVSAGKGGYELLRADLKWGAALGILILILGSVDIYLDYRYSQFRLEKTKNEIVSEFKKNYPEVTRIVDPVSQLKVKIADAKRVTAGLSATTSAVTVLDLLKDISGLAPASTELLIRNFTFENEIIIVKGEVRNFDSVDIIKRELVKSKYFKTVSIGATNLMKQGDKVEFDMRISTK